LEQAGNQAGKPDGSSRFMSPPGNGYPVTGFCCAVDSRERTPAIPAGDNFPAGRRAGHSRNPFRKVESNLSRQELPYMQERHDAATRIKILVADYLGIRKSVSKIEVKNVRSSVIRLRCTSCPS
jgi:hypothetical protein